MTRYFNGDHFDFPKEAVSCLSHISLNLKSNTNFEDFALAVESVHHEILDNIWIPTDEENIKLLREDICLVLKGPGKSDRKFYIFSALSDLYRLIELAVNDNSKKLENFNKKFPESQFPAMIIESKEKMKLHIKKLDYFLSYVKYKWEF